eukprot:13285754-Ditylum_brightwellii.AAC.1
MAVEGSSKCEVVLVTGFSGAGKTTFVEQTIYQPIIGRGGHFMHVKFDQNCQVEPLAAIIGAFEDFCDSFKSKNDDKLSDLIVALQKMMGIKGLTVLAELIPSFGKIINRKVKLDLVKIGNAMTQNQFIPVLQVFVKIISGKESPMVLFLDDLQWADSASLDLVESLIVDSDDSSLLVIESHRENEE